jgi:uncharacterized membrane protein YgcG
MSTPKAPDASGAGEHSAARRTRGIRLCAVAFVAAILALVFLIPRKTPPPPSPAQPDQAFVDRVGMVSPTYAREMAGALLNDPRAQFLVYVDARPPEGDLEAWTVQSASDWKIGTAKNDTGIVLFVFRDARIARVEVGYGLEGLLPDARVRQLLEAALVPQFASGAYEKGFDALLGALRDEMGGAAGQARAAEAELTAPRETWRATVASAFHRVPRMVYAIWRNYMEGDAGTRFGILIFVGVGLGIVLLGVFFAVNTLWRLATLPRNWRARSARVEGKSSGAGAAFGVLWDLKIFEIIMGVFGFGICFAMTVFILLQAEGFVTRKGSFGGGGVSITLPAAPVR